MVRKYLAMMWRNFSPFNSTWTKWDSYSSSAYIKGKMKGCWPPFSDPTMKVVIVLKPSETFWELVSFVVAKFHCLVAHHCRKVKIKAANAQFYIQERKATHVWGACLHQHTKLHKARKTTHTQRDTCTQSLKTQINQAQLTSDCCPSQTHCLDNQQLSKQLCL